MMICERCHYKTELPSNMRKHLRRKSPCEPTYSDISYDDLWNKLFPITETEYICETCGRFFGTRQGLWYHCKRIECKGNNKLLDTKKCSDENTPTSHDGGSKKTQEETIFELQMQIEELQNRMRTKSTSTIYNNKQYNE